MSAPVPFLSELLVLAAVGLAVVLLFRRVNLPPLVGFLLTGVALGPGGFALVRDEKLVHELSEIGVVLLLFTVGLEFSLTDLRRLGRRTFVGGALQVALVVAVVASVLVALGKAPGPALFTGMVLAISSTAVVLKLLGDRGELDAPHGRLATGVLVLQDLVCIAFVLLTPHLARWTGAVAVPRLEPASVVATLGATVTAVALFVVAQRAIPWLLHRASTAGSREAFLFGVLLVVLGSAWLASVAGASLAIGAFLAGLILAKSDLRSQIVADVLPFRDAFASVFFVAIGMSLDVRAVLSQPGLVAAAVAGLFVLKVATGLAAFALAGNHPRVAFGGALVTAQVGEFSFLLLQLAAGTPLVEPRTVQALTAAAVISLALTPVLVAVAPSWGLALGRRWRAAGSPVPGEPGEHLGHGAALPRTGHVVIAGFGLNGRNLARVLRAVHLPHVVVDLNPESARAAAADGTPALIGDMASPAIQSDAHVDHARVLVLALSDPAASRHACRLARQRAAGLFILARTRYVAEIDELYRAGASQVIPEEFETSIEIFTSVLREFHVPGNLAEAQVRLLRQERYGLLRGRKLPTSVVERLDELLAEGVTDTFLLLQHSPAVGLAVRALELGRVRMVAVVRGGDVHAAPGEDFVLRVGDTVVLTGDHAAMDRAAEILRPTDAPGPA